MADAANPASELAKKRWDRLTPEQRREQTAPARAAYLAKKAKAAREAGEIETTDSSYEDALVAVVAKYTELTTEQKTLIAAELRDAIVPTLKGGAA